MMKRPRCQEEEEKEVESKKPKIDRKRKLVFDDYPTPKKVKLYKTNNNNILTKRDILLYL